MIAVKTVLATWNELPENLAAAEILSCCGSMRWSQRLAAARPFADTAAFFDRSDKIWLALDVTDWEEAFSSHPRIGERKAPAAATRQSAVWSGQEQAGVDPTDVKILARLDRGNRLYEQRFGRVFLVCATGKSAPEMLNILERRLENDPDTELREAVEQQRQITQLRLREWLHK